jgi:hypothetical protein
MGNNKCEYLFALKKFLFGFCAIFLFDFQSVKTEKKNGDRGNKVLVIQSLTVSSTLAYGVLNH